MVLATRELGAGEPLIILHGLFGSGDNWHGVGKLLAERFRVILADLPEHGGSPHGERFRYAEAASALRETMDALGLDRAALLGHSMGGKVAMELALTKPERVSALVVADIAPKSYPHYHRTIIDGMKHVSNKAPASRREADEALAEYVPEKPIRSFLLKNFVRKDNGSYAWQVNLPVLDRDYDEVASWPGTEGQYDGPTLFISGGTSEYVSSEDVAPIRSQFPNARFDELPDVGHWLHAEKPEAFAQRVAAFLDKELSPGGRA
jgi:pimeloyl-ACP methyl ester carboxylesterase